MARNQGACARQPSGPGTTGGQATLEWTGLVLLVAALFTGLILAGARPPGPAFAHAVFRRMLCAASLSSSCGATPSLERSYGERIAADIRRYAPDLAFGPDLLGLPVDYRTCRSAWCADPDGYGMVTQSTAGEPVTLFTRTLDCRDGAPSVEPGERGVAARSGGVGTGRPAPDCSGERAGSLFITYWAYYPESASLRGAPVLERKGYHRHDWESFQVRVDADGNVSNRASSHNGYNHTRSVANWGSDAGWDFLKRAVERAGLRERGGWGAATGTYLVAGGSHAGNVEDRAGRWAYPRYTPASRVRLVPLERIRGGPLARPARFDPITPPWEKDVWLDGEAEGTG